MQIVIDASVALACPSSPDSLSNTVGGFILGGFVIQFGVRRYAAS